MNLRIIIYPILCSIMLFGSCISPKLGYFEVNPDARTGAGRIEQPLYVRLNEHIADHFEVKGGEIALRVNDFHKSLYYAFSRSFKDQFMDIQPATPQSSGFILEVQRIEPLWEIKEHKTTGLATAPEKDTWCVVEYASAIYKDGVLVSQSAGSVKAKLGDKNIYASKDLFKEAIKQACSRMTEEHYTKK